MGQREDKETLSAQIVEGAKKRAIGQGPCHEGYRSENVTPGSVVESQESTGGKGKEEGPPGKGSE
jgi:hypothetical protein